MKLTMKGICLLMLCGLVTALAVAKETTEFTCTVKVVDKNMRPVRGAEVAAYELFSESWEGRIRTELLARGQTGADVTFYW